MHSIANMIGDMLGHMTADRICSFQIFFIFMHSFNMTGAPLVLEILKKGENKHLLPPFVNLDCDFEVHGLKMKS